MLIYNVRNSLPLNINAVNHNAFLPSPLHVSRHCFGRLIGHKSTNKVQGGINPRGDPARGYDAQSAQAHGSAAHNVLAGAGGPERDASLPIRHKSSLAFTLPSTSGPAIHVGAEDLNRSECLT